MEGNINWCQPGRSVILKSYSDAHLGAAPLWHNCNKIQTKTVATAGQQVKFSHQKQVEDLFLHQFKQTDTRPLLHFKMLHGVLED